jgi:hypothetical protein
LGAEALAVLDKPQVLAVEVVQVV